MNILETLNITPEAEDQVVDPITSIDQFSAESLEEITHNKGEDE